VLLLDEPTLQSLLEHLESLPQARVLVSQDARLIERLANRAVLLQDGRLTDRGSAALASPRARPLPPARASSRPRG
jgi:ABC-type glutathione transport system ATPase component